MRYPFIHAITLVTIFFAVTSISCNRDKSKTITLTRCVTCANGGLCVNDTCRCPAGYEGTNCETVSRQKFIGNWSVFEKGSITLAAEYPVTISADVDIAGLVIRNFNNYFTSPIKATLTGDTIYIPNQQTQGKVVFGKGYIYSSAAYGQYSAISMAYEIIDTATLAIDDYGYNSAADNSSPSLWNK